MVFDCELFVVSVILVQFISIAPIVLADPETCERGYEDGNDEFECSNNHETDLMYLYDGSRCARKCVPGETKICYFRFELADANAMGAACGDCRNGTMSDCFNKYCIPANGFERPILTINQKVGCIKIVVCLGDTVVVDVHNAISSAQDTSIHWHGLLQRDSLWMDGVPMLTQCPIHTGNVFRYKFRADDPGTQWFHSHSGLQKADGLYGAFVVRNPNDCNRNSYDYDLIDHILVISDWTNYPATTYATGLRSTPLAVNSLTVDGHGIFVNPITKENTIAPIKVIYCQRNKRYRIRFINGGNQNCALEVMIKGHTFKVIATDSFSVKPVDVSKFTLLSGERLDAVLHTTSDMSVDNTYIRIKATGNCKASRIVTYVRIIFIDGPKYERSYDDTYPYLVDDYDEEYVKSDLPTLGDSDCSRSNDPKKLCVSHLEHNYCDGNEKWRCVEQANREADMSYVVNFTLSVTSDVPPSYLAAGAINLVSTINGISYTDPPIPILTQDDPNVKFCNATHLPTNNAVNYCTHMIQFPKCKLIDLYLVDLARTPGQVSHPFHLHGTPSCVMEEGDKKNMGQSGSLTSGINKTPCVKDTVPVPSAGYTKIRIDTCFVGFMFFHCHLEWHLHSGMRMIVQLGEKSEMKKPPKDFPKCGNYLPSVNHYC